MKKFHFPYQKAMEWRDRIAEQERNALEQLHAARNSLDREREAVAEEIGASHAAFASSSTSSAEDLRHLAAFVGALRTKEQAIKNRASECLERITVQTKRCLDADRNHDLLVRLRKREMVAWTREMDRDLEQAAADSWLAGRARSLARNPSPETP